MSDAQPAVPLVRFTRRDGLLVLSCLAVAVVSIVIAARYRKQAFPEASIDFEVTREQAETIARDFMARHGLAPEGGPEAARHAAAFTWDDEARLFLERSFGLERANALMSSDVRAWRWSHRWFTPLRKEEWRVDVRTTGEVVGFSHAVEESAAGERLDEAAARGIAERSWRDVLERPASTWELIETKSLERPNRRDWTFTWKRTDMADLEALDSSYRASVSLQGDRVSGFGEWIHVPEKWRRDYAALRAKNATAGQVASGAMLLTILAILGAMLWEARRRNVPWKLAIAFGVIGGVLQVLASLNALPLAYYNYNTTTSHGAFLSLRLAGAVTGGVGLALFIFLLLAGAEPWYRRGCAGQVSFGKLFTRVGLRTKSMALSLLLGLCMTCFFVAYQVVFYLVAARFGAWAPQEVHYDDLLNTRFPWTVVLLIGFMPATTEEFMSRMFSIPFLHRLLRYRWVAVVLAAFAWGFAHSAYPNQPFFIRGLEVGIGGVIVGIIMLRWGILGPLVWHYTVDALYTGFMLLESDNWYFRLTAGASIGICILPLVVALVGYWRRGGFVPEQGLLNADHPAPEAPPEPEIVAPPFAPRPLGTVAKVVAAACVIVAVGLKLAPHEDLGDGVDVDVSRSEAMVTADARVRALGGDPATYTASAVLVGEYDLVSAKYVLSERPSLLDVEQLYRTRLAGGEWRVRYFRPGEKEEYRILVRADRPEVHEESHLLDEAAPGASLSVSDARPIAVRYLRELGIEIGTDHELKEERSDERPNRLDWTFVWEGSDHVRHSVVVAGDQPVRKETFLKIPEELVRDRSETTWWRGALRVLRPLVSVAIAVGALVLLIVQFRKGLVRVRRSMGLAAGMAGVALVGQSQAWPDLLDAYDTSIDWSLFLTQVTFGVIAAAIGIGVAALVVHALVASLLPGRVVPLRGRVTDGVVAGVGGAAALACVGGLRALVESAWPAAALPEMPFPADLSAGVPAIALVASWVMALVLGACCAGVAAHVVACHLRPAWLRALLFAGAVLLMVPVSARTGPEVLLGAARAALVVAVVVAVVACLWRDNPLAYVIGIGLLSGAPAVAALAGEPDGTVRAHGLLAGAVMLVVLGVIAWRAHRRGLDAPAI